MTFKQGDLSLDRTPVPTDNSFSYNEGISEAKSNPVVSQSQQNTSGQKQQNPFIIVHLNESETASKRNMEVLRSQGSDVRKKISQADMEESMASKVNNEYAGYLNKSIKTGVRSKVSQHSSLSYCTAKGGAKSTSLLHGVAITEEDDDDDYSGQIRIKINKNKQILNHLAKFTKDISSAMGQKDGLTLLFYDFNGSKSSLSTRNAVVSTTNNDSLESKFHSCKKDQRRRSRSINQRRVADRDFKPPDSQDSTRRMHQMKKKQASIPRSNHPKPDSPCFGERVIPSMDGITETLNASKQQSDKWTSAEKNPTNQSQQNQGYNYQNLSQFVKMTQSYSNINESLNLEKMQSEEMP